MPRIMATTAALLALVTIGAAATWAATKNSRAAADKKQATAKAEGPKADGEQPKAEERDEADDPPAESVLPTDDELNFDRPRDLNLLTRDEMLSLAGKYRTDIENEVAHVESARNLAYKNNDLIKLTCIDDKLVQMRLISNMMEPRFLRMLRVRRDEFAVRAEFAIIAPQWRRAKELRAEVETCIGETLTNVSVVTVGQETPDFTGPDPTAVPDPKVNSERVPEASRYR